MKGDISDVTLKNLKDLIEVMSCYNIKHIVFPESKLFLASDKGYLRGLVCDDEKTMYLNEDICKDAMRLTVIHESLHCHNYLNSLGWTEKQIKKGAKRLFKKIYGHKYGIDNFKFED